MFAEGQAGELDGLRWRVLPGSKQAQRPGSRDLVLYASIPQERAVPMSWLFLMADFLCGNEDNLYPPEFGFNGGERTLFYIEKAVIGGWQHATESLEIDKAVASRRAARNSIARRSA